MSPSQNSGITHVCGGSEGCMCMYDPKLNPDLESRRLIQLDDDECKALAWAARRAARYLREEGWPDMANNAEILDAAREKLESS